MKKTLIAILMAAALTVIPVSSALAANTADVTVTATPSFLGIENTPSSWDIGTVTADVDEETGEAYFTLTNVSNVAIDTTIECNGWSGTQSWSYGSPAENQGQLKFGTGSGYNDVVPEVPPGSAATFVDDIAAYATQGWGLQLDTPSSFTHGYVQTTTVTITAAAH
jgi:hypothetical protein